MAIELVVQLANRGRRFTLEPGESIIGSSSASTVRIAHPTVSRRHARIRVRGDRVEVEDLGSRNGTRIGTRKLSGPTELLPGTVVAFGAVSALIERVHADDREPALLLGDTTEGEPSRVPLADTIDRATASVEPFDHFLRHGLATVIDAVRSGQTPRAVATVIGQTLSAALPLLALEITEGGPPSRARSLYELTKPQEDGAAASGWLVTTRDDLRLTYELPTSTLAQLFQPLTELALGLIQLSRGRRRNQTQPVPRIAPAPPPLPSPASVTPAVQGIYADAACVAQGDVSVLIRGASGTGKEVLARYVHAASRRADGPFLALNCAALPQGLLEAELFGIERGVATGVEARVGTFERASGGTLFLDEVGDMALETQAKLLRALEVGELYRVGGQSPYRVDVRIISATNRDLDTLMAEEMFREDLYFRIADWEVELPLLCDRPADIPHLAGHFLAHASRQADRRIRGISRAAMNALQAYDWPGNVRQLQKEMARVALLVGRGELLDSARLSPDVADAARRGSSLKDILQRAERVFLADTLRACDGNRADAAERLAISEITLYRRMKAYGLG